MEKMVQRVGTLADWSPRSQVGDRPHPSWLQFQRPGIPFLASASTACTWCTDVHGGKAPMLMKTNSGCLSVRVPFEEDWNEGTGEGTGRKGWISVPGVVTQAFIPALTTHMT